MNYLSKGNFNFSLNYNVTQENVLSNEDSAFSNVIPPPPDCDFLLLEGGVFLLLNGQNFNLLGCTIPPPPDKGFLLFEGGVLNLLNGQEMDLL